MRALAVELRRELERTVIEARDVAEAGARTALEALAVHHYQPYGHMLPEERVLRNRLRAHAEQLGDIENSKKELQLNHIVHECAYEHWHRMLFARFLAENDLLIEPESGVAISLDECEELAREARTDLWTMASRFAQVMLPQIFRPDEPVLQVVLPKEYRTRLEGLVEGLSREVFLANDSLGWVYQFWQTKRKKQVNDSGVKIGADELPAVTQLFTEDYMVEFLLHNTLGAWWAGKLGPIKADTEEEARARAALSARDGVPAISWTYLRFVQDETAKTWLPAAGTFDAWPKTTILIRLLDPCMGSGHFLVFALLLLVRLRMEEEELSVQAAVDAVLKDNIHGLELDERCTQIAAFNLALTAWKLAGFQALPDLNLACSGLAPRATEAEWMALAENNDRLQRGMAKLYRLFKDAPVLGSLINPRAQGGDLMEAEFHELAPLLASALAASETQKTKFDDDTIELAVTAQGLAEAAEVLAGQFTLVITNVPYLGRGKQDDVLKDYCERVHPEAKADLANCFVERCLSFCTNDAGSTALVTPQNWLFQHTYKDFRRNKLQEVTWNFVIKLGPNAFRVMNWWRATTQLIILDKTRTVNNLITGLDVTMYKYPTDKQIKLTIDGLVQISQEMQLKNPDAIVILETRKHTKLLGAYGRCLQGISPSDRERLVLCFWELRKLPKGWDFLQGSDSITSQSNGRSQVFPFSFFVKNVREIKGAFRGKEAFGKAGISISKMRNLPVTLYSGKPFDGNAHAFIPSDHSNLAAFWSFFSSEEFCSEVRKIDQKGDVTNATIDKVPFDLARWQKVAAEKYPDGLPKPHSNDPTQWIFHGHPAPSASPLQVAIGRLLGYRWPAETDSSMELSSEAREWIDRCKELDEHSESSGIVCIPSIRGQDPASERLHPLLAAAFGDEWVPGKERELLRATGSTAEDLDGWLRSDFFEQHCKLFHHRPFIWHIWDGRNRDGFHVLVNYHKLSEGDGKGRKLLETLTYSYLGDWIGRQQDGVRTGAEGAEGRLAAALALQSRLAVIIEGNPPFDIFVRWKPLHEQPIGWEPDINDGVRLNIRPFMAMDLPNGRSGAGLLRWKPNIKWGKDRGNEPERPRHQFPWFWRDRTFTGERTNDIHLDTATKLQARETLTKGGR